MATPPQLTSRHSAVPCKIHIHAYIYMQLFLHMPGQRPRNITSRQGAAETTLLPAATETDLSLQHTKATKEQHTASQLTQIEL